VRNGGTSDPEDPPAATDAGDETVQARGGS
jgi:hypothetical protein